MMLNKKSTDAIEETQEKQGKKKRPKKPKLTPHEKAVKNKQKVEKQANAKVKRAEAKIKRIEQAARNKEKAAAKKEKDKEKKAANKIKKEEKRIENKQKKKEEKAVNKVKKKEEKIQQKAERMQRKAELAARSPLQKKIDRRLKMKKALLIVLVLLLFTSLIFAGIKFRDKIAKRINLPDINIEEITDNVKSKIPFFKKEEKKETTNKDDEKSKPDPKDSEEQSEEVQEDNVIYIGGSSVLEDFYTQALGEFLDLSNKEIKTYVKSESKNEAYTNLINGDQQVIFSTLPTERESRMADLAGVDLQPIPILNGGFVFIVNKNNPIESLTKTQLYNIYSGTITNWKALGGTDEEILPYQRAENTGSQSGIYKYVIDKSEIINVSDKQKISSTKNIIEEVSSNKEAIGYTYYYYLDKATNKDDIKIISVNGIYPSEKNIANSKYPLTTYSYAIIATEEKEQTLSDVVKSVDARIDANNTSEGAIDNEKANGETTEGAITQDEIPLNLQFVKWLLSNDGQKIAEDKGFIRHNNK